MSNTNSPKTESAQQETILILDFGSQYTQLIARRVREQNIYCEIYPHTLPLSQIEAIAPKGIILSGGPASVYEVDAPKVDAKLFELETPILGICYGMQLMAALLAGGKVHPAAEREYGHAPLQVLNTTDPLFAGLSSRFSAWMSHGDRIDKPPVGFQIIAQTENAPIAAMVDPARAFYGLQFHPEVEHTEDADRILANFARDICRCHNTWTMRAFIARVTAQIQAQVGNERVLCAVSGGVDSMVLATLLHQAIGDALVPVFVDNGLLRKNEAAEVFKTCEQLGISLVAVDAVERFLNGLAGITDPEEKRKVIGAQFIETFKATVTEMEHDFRFLAQGTLYPDVIESVSVKGPSATIKTHHNVGGLPSDMPFELLEPFKELFKDEVRAVGAELNVPWPVLGRHPFPGPGLAVRILREVTHERLEVLRSADAIFISEIKEAGLYDEIWQALAVLLPVKSVGVMGDARTYENAIALRAVTSSDAMTADWARIPTDVLARISNRIINEVQGINRVVYDISSKPPSTIEWE
ncbi:MAG: glutamine-hydrolyzing GMP synthase [Candidatus Poribacteria bacterium]|nr:glutamine-hydrolyzing GMP synthase [Candidatus Poribacteria bacterium]